jgi:ATP-dependent exoDNAse (exonuclease V) beta subunit
MEHVDLGSGAGLEALARQCAAEEGVPGRSAQVAELARRCLRSPAVVRAAASPRPQREVPFCVQVDGELLEGAIDLMFLEEGQLVIVDYKTDLAGSRAEIPVLNSRRIQAELYARAVQAGTGHPVREVVLVFARTGEEWSAWPGDDAGAARES